MRIAVLLVAGLSVGCATTLTEDEYVACKGNQTCLVAALEDKIQQEKYEAEDRRIRHDEELAAYIIACKATGNVIWEKRSGTRVSKPLVDKHGVVHLPRHASSLDFVCISPFDTRRILEGINSDGRFGRRR